MESNQVYQYDYACNQMNQINGIRFAAIINNKGRKIAGGFSPNITPLEKDQQKIEMLFMEMALDLSMRKEFDNTLGSINAIVSYRNKTNIITIPHQDNFMLISSEPELESSKIILMAKKNLKPMKIMEVISC
ncbi:DUF6659 family protein [Candidatus Nitrosarchaeum limnium]|uniref:Roadblock/LAMTOR2 domain-containing protein n=1 Tax=Candidatus Nitrosarchaeum limnium BG20 TaxID=859192 RepID=S2E3M7_9ARCH|nr:DUF6659 family protein [Candidatus Nitrosarchaeum limnium]EPA05403.1 hypothetical protein BG20_I0709 [Candidatus Nitrosarchaeum limnium BG20]